VDDLSITTWHTYSIDVGALPDLDRLDNEALKALVVEQREQHLKALSSKTQQIEHLKLVVEKFRRMIFGAKSEKAVIQVEQFELQLEETETEQAASGPMCAMNAQPVKTLRRPCGSLTRRIARANIRGSI
jgi:hypothetical protein